MRREDRGWWVALVAVAILAGGVFAASRLAFGEGPKDGRPETPPVIDKTPTASAPGAKGGGAATTAAAPAPPGPVTPSGAAVAAAVADDNATPATAAAPPAVPLEQKAGPTRLWALDLVEREAALAGEKEALAKEQEALAARVAALELQNRDLEARKAQVADLAKAVGAQWDAQAARLTTPDPNAIVLPANTVEANAQLDLVASIIKKMKPKAAAELMQTWKDPLQVDILGRLQPRVSSAILNVYDPTIGGRVTTELARLGLPTPIPAVAKEGAK